MFIKWIIFIEFVSFCLEKDNTNFNIVYFLLNRNNCKLVYLIIYFLNKILFILNVIVANLS